MLPIPANSVFALFAAASWGMGDFSGGMGVKSAPSQSPQLAAALRVVLLSHVTSLCVLLCIAYRRGDAFPHGLPLLAGVLAGAIASLAVCGFYLALSRGAMGASAAISGLLAAAIPATFAIFQEGSPGVHRLTGFAVAALAIWLIAAGPAEKEERSTILLATLAGLGFGIYFVALKYAGASGIVWPMATARMGSLVTCTLFLGALRLLGQPTGPVPISRKMLFWILCTALFDTAGNMLFFAATRTGRLDIASVLASLYPAGTILLAAFTLGERLTKRQLLGMLVALPAVLLITI